MRWRRLAVWCIAALMVPVVASAQMAHVQHDGIDESDSASTETVTLAAATAGSAFAGFIQWEESVASLDSISGCGATWAIVNNPTSGSGGAEAALFYGCGASAGACTVTATFSGVPGSMRRHMMVHEASGGESSSCLDASSLFATNNPPTTADGVVGTLVSVLEAGSYVFVAMACNQQGGDGDAGNEGTLAHDAGAECSTSEYQIEGVGSFTPEMTRTGSAFSDPVIGVIVLDPAGAAPAPSVPCTPGLRVGRCP